MLSNIKNIDQNIKNIDQLDFIKGIAALSVILLHTIDKEALIFSMAYYHIWQAVPLFILISFFLLFKKTEKNLYGVSLIEGLKYYYSYDEILKLIKKIIIPFICFQFLLLILIFSVKGIDKTIEAVFHLGTGPGAYYPFLYLQIWLLSPFLYLLFKRKGVFFGGVFY